MTWSKTMRSALTAVAAAGLLAGLGASPAAGVPAAGTINAEHPSAVRVFTPQTIQGIRLVGQRAALADGAATVGLVDCMSMQWNGRTGFTCTEWSPPVLTAVLIVGDRVQTQDLTTGAWVDTPYRYDPATNLATWAPELVVRPAPNPDMGRSTQWAVIYGTKKNPGRWNRCSPIRWKADFTGLAQAGGDPAAERARLASTLAEISRITGYRFVYAGTSKFPLGAGRQPTPKVTGKVDLAITFGASTGTKGYRVPGFADNGPIGYAFATPRYFTPVRGGRRGIRITRAVAVFDARAVLTGNRNQDPHAVAGLDMARALYMHEIGHAMGLQHVTSQQQIMFPSALDSIDDRYGAGDTTGLRTLARMACFTTGR
jgi:hypothetical protein